MNLKNVHYVLPGGSIFSFERSDFFYVLSKIGIHTYMQYKKIIVFWDQKWQFSHLKPFQDKQQLTVWNIEEKKT